MEYIENIEALEALYPKPADRSLNKVHNTISPLYREWIEASRFLILSTVGVEGTDASPRGDDGPVVQIFDEKTILLPDWRGNNRLDSLRNIVRDERASLMFLINGEKIVVRVNGRARLTRDDALRDRFDKDGKRPITVIVFTVVEAYFQCAKSIMRSKIWEHRDVNVPSTGALLAEKIPEIEAEEFDASYEDYAKGILWR